MVAAETNTETQDKRSFADAPTDTTNTNNN